MPVTFPNKGVSAALVLARIAMRASPEHVPILSGDVYSPLPVLLHRNHGLLSKGDITLQGDQLLPTLTMLPNPSKHAT
jgi:hypothetical protein